MTAERILLVTPSFFGYEGHIAAAMRRAGAVVTVVDERPSNSAVFRAVVRARPRLAQRRIEQHFRDALASSRRSGFDRVVVVKGETTPRWFLDALRSINPLAVFVLYLYDSVANEPRPLTLLDAFDRAYSFDRQDVAQIERLEYKPLFHVPAFSAAARPGPERDIAISFVGTLHSDRYAYVNAIAQHFTPSYRFFYSPARWYFLLTKYVTRQCSHVPIRDVSFDKLRTEDVARVFGRSRVVIDMQRDDQQGLTMRTFEVLAAGAVLVTSNRNIRDEPGIDQSRVVVGDDPAVIVDQLRARLDAAADLDAGTSAPPGSSVDEWVGDLLR